MARMRARLILYSVTILLGVTAALPAAALTAGDILDKMSKTEQTAYMFGSAETAAFLAHVNGNVERGRCITKWFSEKGVAEMVEAMNAYKEHEAQPIIYTLINRACGK
jgi:hypothetical protein